MLQNLFEAELVYLSFTKDGRLPITTTKFKRYNINDLKSLVAEKKSINKLAKIKPLSKLPLRDMEDEYFREASKSACQLLYIKIKDLRREKDV